MRSHWSGYGSILERTGNSIDMDIYEASVHSFIVKIWLEETVEEAGQATWRGHITHVPTGKRQYLRDLDTIVAFVSPYIEGMGVKPSRSRLLRQWLRGWKRWLKP